MAVSGGTDEVVGNAAARQDAQLRKNEGATELVMHSAAKLEGSSRKDDEATVLGEHPTAKTGESFHVQTDVSTAPPVIHSRFAEKTAESLQRKN